MTVDQLRKALEGVPGNLRVVTSGSDHSYYEVEGAGHGYAEQAGRELWEYWDDENMSPNGVKIEIFYVG
jgi:hypothetical protein